MSARSDVKRKNQPEVLVIGCGAVGTSCLYYLRKTARVFGYDCDPIRVGRLARAGVRFSGARVSGRVLFDVASSMEPYRGKVFDAVIFSTKCSGLGAAVRDFAAEGFSKRFLFLQNGDEDLFWAGKLLRAKTICRGVTTMAASLEAAGHVRIHAAGEMFFGSPEGEKESVRWFSRLFSVSGFRVSPVGNIVGAVWAKLIFNAVMNPLPVLCSQSYAVLRRDFLLYSLAKEAMLEGVAAARQAGVRLAFDPLKKLRAVREGKLNADDYFGSMYADVSAGRVTEIEELTGLLVRRARKMGLMVPCLNAIYTLTRSRLGGKDG